LLTYLIEMTFSREASRESEGGMSAY